MEKKITIEIEDETIEKIQRIFPKLAIDSYIHSFIKLAFEEFVHFFSGERRYTSLSHQYIEWMNNINEIILPDMEITSRILMNNFNFPPGSALYISRILRDRNNVTLVNKAIVNIKSKFREVLDSYNELPPKERGNPGKLYSITLSKREYNHLQLILDEWEEEQLKLPLNERNSINYPDISENRKDFVKISYSIDQIELIENLIN